MSRQSLYEFKRDGILQAIETLTYATGRPPSLRELSDAAGVSIATLHSYLSRMQQEGAITWQRRSHRSVRVTGFAHSGLGLSTRSLLGSQP